MAQKLPIAVSPDKSTLSNQLTQGIDGKMFTHSCEVMTDCNSFFNTLICLCEHLAFAISDACVNR